NTIPDKCFASTALSTIIFPNTLKTIGDNAFNECDFVEINLPEQLEVIGYGAFSKCSNLLTIEIPSSVIEVGYRSFEYCSALKNFSIKSTNLISIPSGLCGNCTNLSSIIIPDGVKIIEDAFYGCIRLKEITIPGSVTEISEKAFDA